MASTRLVHAADGGGVSRRAVWRIGAGKIKPLWSRSIVRTLSSTASVFRLSVRGRGGSVVYPNSGAPSRPPEAGYYSRQPGLGRHDIRTPMIDQSLVHCYGATGRLDAPSSISCPTELRLDPTRKGMVPPREEEEQGTTMVMAKQQEVHNSLLISQLAVRVVYLH